MNDWLVKLADTAMTIEYLEKQIPSLVAEARDGGASWAAVGRALGCSAQNAHRRFGPARKDINTLPLSDPLFNDLFDAPQD